MSDAGGALASRCRTENTWGVLPQDLQGNKAASYFLHCSQLFDESKMKAARVFVIMKFLQPYNLQ